MNIAFHYLYRDGANYKNFNTVIFNNPTEISIEQLQEWLKLRLIWFDNFDATEWKIPDIHFGSWDNEFDHTWHEFGGINYTKEPSNFSMPLWKWVAMIEWMELTKAKI
jgi:hypothetical protein